MIGKLLWVALTVVFTFCFIVLFENGPTNYVENLKTEFVQAKEYLSTPAKKKTDGADKL